MQALDLVVDLGGQNGVVGGDLHVLRNLLQGGPYGIFLFQVVVGADDFYHVRYVFFIAMYGYSTTIFRMTVPWPVRICRK